MGRGPPLSGVSLRSTSGKASRLGGTFGGEYNKNINYSVYILKSKKDDRYYIGQTNNLKERLRRHDTGQVLSTKHRRPFILLHAEVFEKRSEAMKREKYLKSLKGGSEWKRLEKQWSTIKR
ncbi:MAG: GIY-YIG nuclease family protein [Candidatus Gracilibacteria bacterium]|nr:GIY-YIG nuclease family protein [Candidatus Gracilibacteria bacterium]